MLNAFDLAALLRPSPASLDIICHSRGGLVARWYCEAYADAALKRRVVFVGAPLAGTSFAAAPRLKSALDLLTNIADVLRTASDLASANPLFLATSGLLRVVGAVTGVAASTPMLDAAIALVPGLDGQSRTGNNQELLRLRANTGASDFTAGHIRYFAVRGNFEPKEMGWNFLRFFSKPLQRVGDWGADIIFPDHNDLIVDTGSMAEVADNRLVAVAHDFGTTDRVHHTNYFAQAETAAAVRRSFGIA
jgi:pimeloyl-ACP methyl ester carboxylesterase